jgi:hypothetical protein
MGVPGDLVPARPRANCGLLSPPVEGVQSSSREAACAPADRDTARGDVHVGAIAPPAPRSPFRPTVEPGGRDSGRRRRGAGRGRIQALSCAADYRQSDAARQRHATGDRQRLSHQPQSDLSGTAAARLGAVARQCEPLVRSPAIRGDDYFGPDHARGAGAGPALTARSTSPTAAVWLGGSAASARRGTARSREGRRPHVN